MHEDHIQQREDTLFTVTVHPDTVAFLKKLEGDPKWTRRLWTTTVVVGAAALALERIRRLLTKTGREHMPSPVTPPESTDPPVAPVFGTTTESEQEMIRESVWDRKPGKIEKGEIVYVPIERPDGKRQYVSLQFVDESVRKTLLLVNGEECEQTADGWPVKVTSIELREGGTIEINGVAMVLMSGTSLWDAKKIADMHEGLKRDGEFPFTITALIDASGMIRKRQKADETASEDEKPDVEQK